MTEIPENFIGLTGTAWTGLSAVATFLAVVVALFLPSYQEYKQNKNILALIKIELDDNYSLLVKTENWKDQEIGGQKLLALDQKIAAAEHIKLKIWNEFKYKLAVYSSKKYEQHKDLIDVLERIADYRTNIIANIEPKKTMATTEIESQIGLFISKYKEAK